jgi:hypothetical protein
MIALIVLPMSLALAWVAPGLGWPAHILLAAVLTTMLGSGQLVCRALGCRDDPFLALIVGFVLVAHALLAANFIVPGMHPIVVAAFALPAAAGFLRGRSANWRSALGIAAGMALFTVAWNIDVAPRLAHFYATGRLDFWLDILVHAGTLAQFATSDAVGRGMVLMADTPLPLYHFASYMPAALLTSVMGTPPLDAVVLAWVPLGVLIMACGVVSLGLALGGPSLAVLALAAVAFMPAPERLALGNGFLGFAWLIETGPGTPYSLGVACAALAALVRWTREQRRGALALAFGLVAGCFLIRVNTFIWLAPVVALGAVAGWRRPAPSLRLILVVLGLIGLAGFLAALSWPALRASPGEFLFSYIEFVHGGNAPQALSDVYPLLVRHLGRAGAGTIGVGLAILGTVGPWLPAFVFLGLVTWRRRRLRPEDAVPVLLLAVAALAMLMAPMARNGDMSEFRHRALPLLVIVMSVWCLRFGRLLITPLFELVPALSRQLAVAMVAVLSFGVLAATIGAAKQPRMAWGRDFYGTQVAPELIQLAPLLLHGADARPRFAVANQPADSRNIDDAARLVALSGVPAYISCPAFLLVTGGHIGDEARRRMAVMARLAGASDLAELQATMRSEGITWYVVTSQRDAAFDSERRDAIGHAGKYAVYASAPSR